jgi:hypothetical protein
MPSGERRSLLMKVPLDDLTSLMKIYSEAGIERRTHLATLLPDLCVKPRQHLGIKVRVPLSGNRLGVGLPSDFDLS